MKLRQHCPCVLLVLVSACWSYGPATLRHTQLAFNEAAVSVLNQQALLNVVRTRYRDTPYFLEISTITSQSSSSSNFGLGGSATFAAQVGGAVTPTVGGLFTQTPTVVFSPLSGKDYVQRLLSPLPLHQLLLLSQSGWSIERVLTLGVDRISDLENAPTAAGPTPLVRPVFSAFKELAQALRSLQLANRLQLGVRKNPDELVLVLSIRPSTSAQSAEATFRRLLSLDPKVREITLRALPTQGSVVLQTRSLFATLSYLANGVDIPREHERKGLAVITRNPDQSPFQWQELLGKMFRVHSQKREPTNAYVQVYYRGYHYFIRDDDHDTKATFLLLTQLFSLQSDPTRGVVPMLTIPAGR